MTNHKNTHLSVLAIAMLANFGAMAQQPVPQPLAMSFFVAIAEIGSDANLTSLADADARCQQLATTVGAGQKTWRAYISRDPKGVKVDATGRVGPGPWQNAMGTVIAKNVDDLGTNPNINNETALTERGTMITDGASPNWHAPLTGAKSWYPHHPWWHAPVLLFCCGPPGQSDHATTAAVPSPGPHPLAAPTDDAAAAWTIAQTHHFPIADYSPPTSGRLCYRHFLNLLIAPSFWAHFCQRFFSRLRCFFYSMTRSRRKRGSPPWPQRTSGMLPTYCSLSGQ